MSKVKNDSLFHLIRSLTKSEKWQFKVYASRVKQGQDKKFIQLFDAIDKQKEYNEDALLSLKTLNPSQLPNLKTHLYKQLLTHLSHYNSSTPESTVTRYSEHARFLYDKCLYADCLTILEKAKRSARENYQLVLLLELLNIEKLALIQTSGQNASERVNKLVEEITSVTEQIQNINRYSNLALQLNTFYQIRGFIRNHEDFMTVQSFYKKQVPQVSAAHLSAQEKMYLYYTITGYNFYVQDFKAGYANARKWVALFENDPALIRAKTEFYIKALNNLLVVQNKLYLYSEFKETHNKLVSLKRRKDIILSENLQLNLFKAIYIHEINRHFMLGEYKSGTRVVAALNKELMNFIPKLSKHTVMIFYYKIACLYFGSYQFKTAIKWLNRIINEKESGLREDLQSFARILRLICYYELNSREMIEYNIRSTYRFLQKKQSFVKYQLLIMKFLRSIKKTDTEKELTQQFSVLKNGMQKLEKSRFEKRAFIYFDIISWLESKIEHKPMQDIIKEKHKRILK
ncbi:MAG: hypothetical protein JST26_19625 [Bacteroidetes bacterium]|nr:hypothetical protein [Bacteroidota bacterium]